MGKSERECRLARARRTKKQDCAIVGDDAAA